MRKRGPTFAPPRQRASKNTVEPTSPMAWEALAVSLRQERDAFRSALQGIAAVESNGCAQCIANADAARYTLRMAGR